MREGKIDLDWLDGEIASDIYDFRFRGALDYVRKNCKPIEESKPVFLSKTCTNQWESNQYCDKKNACEMCQLK